MLIALASAADVSVEWLAAGSGPKRPTREAHDLAWESVPQFVERFRLLVGREGGIDPFVARTGLDHLIVNGLFAGGPLTVKALEALSSNPEIPVRWLFSGSEKERDHAGLDSTTMRKFWTRVQAIDDDRIYSGTISNSDIRFAHENYDWKQPIFELLWRVYEKLPPAFYELHRINDDNNRPLFSKGDIAVVDVGPSAAGPGYCIFDDGVDSHGLRVPSFVGQLVRLGSELCLKIRDGSSVDRFTPMAEIKAKRLGDVVLLIKGDIN